jgi:hypothetical protein
MSTIKLTHGGEGTFKSVLLMVGNRLVMMSFQSLEDRIAKEIFIESSKSKSLNEGLNLTHSSSSLIVDLSTATRASVCSIFAVILLIVPVDNLTICSVIVFITIGIE